MIHRKTDFFENSRASFCVGYLLMKALPAAAVSAGWTLSASLGTVLGEIISAVIFVLGCSVMLVAHQIENQRIYAAAALTAAVIAVVAWHENVHNIWSAAELLLTAAAITMGHLRKRYLMQLTAAAGLALLIITGFPQSEMLLPLSAALTAGAALSELAAIPDINGGYTVCGMTAALVLNLLT